MGFVDRLTMSLFLCLPQKWVSVWFTASGWKLHPEMKMDIYISQNSAYFVRVGGICTIDILVRVGRLALSDDGGECGHTSSSLWLPAVLNLRRVSVSLADLL